MIEAATMFRKSGFTDEMSLQLAEEASLFQNIADSEVSAADASSFLIATMKGFNIEAQDTRSILDSVNQVANEYAVSTTDLSTALPKVAATMSQAGNSLSETIALLTSAMEVMPNQASRIARGFRSITLNLQGMTDEGEESQELVSKMEADFNKLGLTLMGTDGQLKSTFEIFSDLASVWDTLDRNTQNYYAALIGGKTQVDVVNSALTNFSTALAANETALNSSGSATRENARYMESLQARLQALKSEWQALVTDGGVVNKFIKLLLDAGTALLRFANTGVGKVVVTLATIATTMLAAKSVISTLSLKVTSLSGLLTTLGTRLFAVSSNASQAILAFFGLSTAEGNATLATKGFSTALKTVPFLAAVAVIGVLVSKLVSASNNIANLTQRFNEATSALQESTNKIQQLQSEYDSLASLASQRILTAEEEKRRDLIYQSLKAEKELQKVKAQEAYKAYASQKTSVTETRTVAAPENTLVNTYKQIINDLWKAFGGEENLFDYSFEMETAAESADHAIYALTKHHREYGDVLDAEYATLVDYVAQMNAYKDAGVELSEEEENRLAKASELIGYLQVENELMETFSTLTSDLASNGLKMLHNAWVEVNTTGEINANTYAKLIALFPQLANGAVQTANGYKLADGALEALLKAENTQVNMASYLNAAASQVVSAEIQKKYAFDGTTASIVRQLKAQEALLKAQIAADAAAGHYVSAGSGIVVQLSKVTQLLNEIENYKPPSVGGGGASGALNNVGSAASQANDQVKELTNSLKEQTDVLKQAADLMVSKIDLEIEALQRQKDEIQDVNDALDEQIELEKALDALARAKSKKVLAYKDGQFQYVTDTAAVGEAQKQLSEVQRKQARQAALDEIDRQIDALRAEQDTWKNVSKAYDEYLGKQALGIDQEAQNWQDRLGQAQLFADEYLKIMQTIADVESGKLSISQGQSIVSQAKNFSGTIPKSTSTLLDPMQASMASWSSINSMASPSYSSIGGGGVTVIQQFGDISLPNVTNVNQFIEELSNYKQYAVQSATQR